LHDILSVHRVNQGDFGGGEGGVGRDEVHPLSVPQDNAFGVKIGFGHDVIHGGVSVKLSRTWREN